MQLELFPYFETQSYQVPEENSITLKEEASIYQRKDIKYPYSDSKPMAESTIHYQNIIMIEQNLSRLFKYSRDVFVAADLFWYPAKGKPYIKLAPDVLLVFNRPKGHRKSYLQWKEDNIPPQVIFEILSDGNDTKDLQKCFEFYAKYGVEEYFTFNTKNGLLGFCFCLGDDLVQALPFNNTYKSPLMNIELTIKSKKLIIYNPDGTLFMTYQELEEEKEKVKKENKRKKKLQPCMKRRNKKKRKFYLLLSQLIGKLLNLKNYWLNLERRTRTYV